MAAARYYYDKLREDDKPTRVLLVADPRDKTTGMAEVPKSNPPADPPKQTAAPATFQAAPVTPPAASSPPPPLPTLAPNKLLSEGSIKMETKPAPQPRETPKSPRERPKGR